MKVLARGQFTERLTVLANASHLGGRISLGGELTYRRPDVGWTAPLRAWLGLMCDFETYGRDPRLYACIASRLRERSGREECRGRETGHNRACAASRLRVAKTKSTGHPSYQVD